MPEDDFFLRQLSAFSAHRRMAMEMAGRDEMAERHISTAEYELSQTHRVLSGLLHDISPACTHAAAHATTETAHDAATLHAETVPARHVVAA